MIFFLRSSYVLTLPLFSPGTFLWDRSVHGRSNPRRCPCIQLPISPCQNSVNRVLTTLSLFHMLIALLSDDSFRGYFGPVITPPSYYHMLYSPLSSKPWAETKLRIASDGFSSFRPMPILVSPIPLFGTSARRSSSHSTACADTLLNSSLFFVPPDLNFYPTFFVAEYDRNLPEFFPYILFLLAANQTHCILRAFRLSRPFPGIVKLLPKYP